MRRLLPRPSITPFALAVPIFFADVLPCGGTHYRPEPAETSAAGDTSGNETLSVDAADANATTNQGD